MVTAVVVAHDGVRWLPQALAGLLGQDRPVQRIVAADTGSTDESHRLLADAIGGQGVVQLARRTGFGAAVNEAVRVTPALHPEELPYDLSGALAGPGDGPQGRGQFGDPLGHHDELAAEQAEFAGRSTEPVEWLWLLHDDCEPQTDALRQLLRTAEATPTAAVVGPKLRSWYDRRQLLEVGVSIARSGRRWTGLDRREQDQGQRDQVRPVLSVSSAGMLIRRDVFEQLGGFDQALPLMRDDVDLCWRVAAAGHRVVVAPDAVLRHAEAAARERRPIDCAPPHPHRVDKAGAVWTVLANTRGALLPYVFLRILLSTLVRTVGYLLGKVPGQALDELAGFGHVLLRAPKLLAARARRARTRSRHDALDDRALFPAPGATIRLTVEQLAADLIGRAGNEAFSSRHGGGAVESGPGDEDADFLEVEQFSRLRRLARRPGPVLFAGLLVVTLAAARGLLGSGPLSGGALLPTPGGASALWSAYADAWHTAGGGTTATSAPYLGVVAVLGGLLFGHASLAVTLLLVLAAPVAGVSAYLVSRPLVESRLVRAWAAAGYAFLPAVTGAVAQGRLGTAVFAILLPLLARSAAVAVGLGISSESAARGVRPGWRSAWVATLLLTVATAFVPVVWVLGLVLAAAALGAAAVRGGAFGTGATAVRGLGARCAVMVLVPLVVLAPWSLGLLTHPGRLLLEAGVPGVVGQAPTAADLVLLDPGGHGAAPGLLTLGILLAALAALLRSDRRRAVLAAWGAAAVCLLGGILTAGGHVTAGPGQPPVTPWAGPATLLAGLALLAAAATGADGARSRVAGVAFGWRQPVAALVVAAAALAPVASAGWWLVRGAAGPVERGSSEVLPSFIGEESQTVSRIRTLVLRPSANGAAVSYALETGGGPTLGDAELQAATTPVAGLSGIVGSLLSGSGGDPVSALEGYGVQYIVVEPPVTSAFATRLDQTPGLNALSATSTGSIWRLADNVSRAAIEIPAGAGTGSSASSAAATTAPVPLPAGQVGVRATVPAGPAGRVLRLADRADAGWQATLNGEPLPATTVDGWAQGFKLPATGGDLVVGYHTGVVHKAWIAAQGLLAVVLLVLALPGRRDRTDDDLPEAAEAASALADEPPVPGSRRARRLAAAAAAAGGTESAEAAGAPGAAGGEPGAEGEAAGGADPAAYPAVDPVTGAPYAPDPAAPAGYGGYPDPRQPGYDPGYPAAPGYEQYEGYEGYDPAAYPAPGPGEWGQGPPVPPQQTGYEQGWDGYGGAAPAEGGDPYWTGAPGQVPIPGQVGGEGYGSLPADDPWLAEPPGPYGTDGSGTTYRPGSGS